MSPAWTCSTGGGTPPSSRCRARHRGTAQPAAATPTARSPALTTRTPRHSWSPRRTGLGPRAQGARHRRAEQSPLRQDQLSVVRRRAEVQCRRQLLRRLLRLPGVRHQPYLAGPITERGLRLTCAWPPSIVRPARPDAHATRTARARSAVPFSWTPGQAGRRSGRGRAWSPPSPATEPDALRAVSGKADQNGRHSYSAICAELAA
jgi:hypothetical protein